MPTYSSGGRTWYSSGVDGTRNLARGGGAGSCAVCLVGFGAVLLIPGTIMMIVAYGDSTWSDSFFDSMRMVATVLFSIGLILCLVGIPMCCIARRNLSASHGNVTTTLPAAYASTTTTTIQASGPTSGSYPVGQQVPSNQPGTYQVAGQYPAQQSPLQSNQVAYPPAQGSYPPAQGSYPPAQGSYPQGAYPPAQGAYPPAQGAYPPAQGANLPEMTASIPTAPPENPDFSIAKDFDGPPPSYNEVMDHKH